MAANEEAIAILNELLAMEQGQFALRLVESTPFISRAGVEQARLLRELEDKARRHAGMLSDAVIRLEGSPGMRFRDINSAHVHFQQIQVIWPELVDDVRRLVQAYRVGAEKLAGCPQAARVTGDILADHEHSLQQLESSLAAMRGESAVSGSAGG